MSAPKETDKIAVFKGRGVRRVLLEGKWWFSVVDVVSVLTDSDNPRDYWYKMKIREKDEADVQLSTICRQFKLTAPDTPEVSGGMCLTPNSGRVPGIPPSGWCPGAADSYFI